MKFDIRSFFEKSVENVQVSLKSDKNNENLNKFEFVQQGFNV